MRVLHVTDCMTSGTGEAILDIAGKVSKAEHFLLYDYRKDAPPPIYSNLDRNFADSVLWKSGLVSRYAHLIRTIKKLNPDYVYLHSTYAGVYGRLVPLKVKILYSAHGFAFQKNDFSNFQKRLSLLAERCLSIRRQTYVALWPLEFLQAQSMLYYQNIEFMSLRIIQNLKASQFLDNQSKVGKKNFAIVGRITPSKDPLFAIEVAHRIRSLDSEINIHWIGEYGDQISNSALDMQDSGIIIEPWLEKELLLEYLKSFQAVLITSSWEAGPLVLFESLTKGVPIIARKIPAVEILGIQSFDSADDFALEVVKVSNSRVYRKALFETQFKTICRVLSSLPEVNPFK